MLAAIGDAKTCPHGHPIERRPARIEGVPLADVEVGATVKILRFENEAEDLLHYLKASRRGARHDGHARRAHDEEVVVAADDGRARRPHAAASRRPSASPPTRRRRRGPRCPSSS